ncbi:MAG: hypothetical protein HZB26_09610 [Candidatus Hydrogenedentes bacterium]|nr:hypothetical protein [Candidatus Hydrogenedentota bacterium]
MALGAQPAEAKAAPTFGEDASFLEQHSKAFVLQRGDSQVVVSPLYQGRVMTSTWGGKNGLSNGWINRDFIASGKLQAHINVFGGEDRFWLGPEGGQFSIFFKPGAKFTVDDWQTPAPIDSDAYDVANKAESSVTFRKTFDVSNMSGTVFHVKVERKVSVLERGEISGLLKAPLPDSVQAVAYQTASTVTNAGDAPWKKETGLLAIWILGMYKPSPQTTTVIPINSGDAATLGAPVTDNYFGKIPGERLKVTENAIFFKGDGGMRGKLGVNPKRSKGVMGSYDAANRVLTVVTYNTPDAKAEYVNNLWEEQKNPYSGDAIMAYNDGPLGPGKPPLGPFYELETSSPALALAPNASYTHDHRTVHMHGTEAELDTLAKKIFGVGLDAIKGALK